jgi:hypothetical protein
MNPSSIEGDSINSSPEELMFRASLGGELYTGSLSIHPKVTGSWVPTSSFVSDSNFNFFTTPTFVPNTEYFFYDQPAVGIKNAISDKIRLENNVMPSGNTLSPFRSLAQQLAISQSYTANTNLLEVAFSPQDEINEDIMDQIGYFNIGEYIGDPRLRSSSAESYPLLDTLRNEYFQKYTKNYNLVDYIRLIKFFDNSLFKMIKDFVPARTSLASGIVIKQHLLERNKYPQPQVNNNSTIAYYSSGSSNNQPLTFQNIIVTGTVAPQWNDFQPGTIEDFNGGAGGVFNSFNYVGNTSQSWYETIPTISGSVIILHNTQDEFYDGEFSGSNIIVTTQSLAQSYPLDNFVFDYTPVRYSPLLYDLSIDDLAEFTQNQFLNSLTIPDQGEILLLRPYFRLGGFSPSGNPLPNITGPTYVKIHKFDNNGVDNTIPLGQANKLLIQYSTIPSYYTLNILTVNEYSTYYLYEVNTLGSNTADNYILDYKFSGSIVNSFTAGPFSTPLALTESIDNANVFISSSSTFTYSNTPNVKIDFIASFTGKSTSAVATSSLTLFFPGLDSVTTYTIPNFPISTSPAVTRTISGSIYPLNASPFTVNIFNNGGFFAPGAVLSNVQFQLTQSIAPSAAENDPIIIEPYITLPNFYNSDYNALLNNVDEYRLSTVYQDVDYSTNITTPTNFGLLISGSAIKAAVQDSNYTTKRHIIPRYEGSKSTSQYLNVWTEGDSGTYGKVPTVESLKTMVAYCDSISGWPPERMNASAIHVLYLIKQDGTVVIPNASQNSLADIQGTFMSGEKLLIRSKTIGSGEAIQSRNIIRGGTRIEPILYTQYGQAPNALWNTTMSFTDIIPSNTGATGNYSALYSNNSNFTPPYEVWSKVPLTITTYGTTVSNNEYTVPLGVITDGVNLIIQAEYNIDIPGSSGFPIYGRVVKQRGAALSYYPDISGVGQYYYTGYLYNNEGPNTFTIPTTELESGDKIYIEIYCVGTFTTLLANITNPKLNISQYPIFSQPVTSSGANSIWNWPNSSSYPYVITSSQTTLVNLYGDPNVRMVDITGSGFNSISSPWSIKYGDEFRFEGREDFVYQVGKIFGPAESGSGRIFPTGSIEVHLNSNLPISALTSVFNLDHFAIRRYVDDASLILMEGFKPVNASGPYIVRPEYVVPELNKSVDQFILDLTQKGLIT